MSASDLSSKTTHDLWVESRQFRLEISRPAANTIELKVTRPIGQTTVDGAVITLHDKPIIASNYPSDGTQYVGSLDYAAPVNWIESPSGAHVVAFYSSILNQPMPAGTPNAAGTETTFTLTITGTVDSQIYYASIHGASNVLQYYPVGVQSYPLEGARVEKGVSTYTGAIPSFPEAPTSPTVGTVYHDEQLDLVQYWTGTTWIPSRSDSILTGPVNPGVQGQPHILRGSALMVFSGSKWMGATPANFQVRIPGPAWAPFAQISSNTFLPTAPIVGQFVWNYTTERIQYWDGVEWQFPGPSNTLFDPGTGPVPAFTQPITFEYDPLPDPYIGQLFYNTTTRLLNAWNGTTWKQVNTDQEGTPISDRIAVGNDGSYDERVRMIQVLKNQLGWPVQCVELKEEQFNVAIDNALDNYRMWVDNAYTRRFIMFQLFPGQQTYYLNSQSQKTDKIVDVMKIHRLNILGIEQANGNDAVWSSGILTSYYSAATVDILSLHLLSSLSEEFQRIFAGDMTYLWNEPSRELLITRKVNRTEKVILEVACEKPEQEIMVDRWSKQFIQNWALAECKEMLGLIRSKFSSGTPGAAGTITLNGELLISEARQDMAELKQSALDYEWGGHVGWGNVSFLIG
jgi:hypothetical protein